LTGGKFLSPELIDQNLSNSIFHRVLTHLAINVIDRKVQITPYKIFRASEEMR